MSKITIDYNDLTFLVQTALQFGIDSPELIPDKKSKEKVAKWMVDNTINDINNKSQDEGLPSGRP